MAEAQKTKFRIYQDTVQSKHETELKEVNELHQKMIEERVEDSL